MIEVLPAGERFHTDIGWLNSRHTFSFGDHYDPDRAGFHALRVINDDRVAPGKGFGTHGHRDMEIISYVLDGQLEHKDNMGTGSLIVPGDVQRMSAGRGVLHSEYNPSRSAPVHFLQIWIEPDVTGIAPSYEQKAIAAELKRGRFALIASPDGRDRSVTIHQDARIYAGLFDGAEAASHDVAPGRRAYVHVARGSVSVNGNRLEAGDAAAITGEAAVRVEAGADAEVLLFDLN